jgi:site-specific recombinase XerD
MCVLARETAKLRFLGRIPLGPMSVASSARETTHLDVQEFLARSAQKQHASRFVRHQLYALRVFFDFLNLGGLVKWVPPRVVRLRRIERQIPSVPTKEQVENVMGAACTDYERALLEVLYGTGRTGELRLMRVENIDFHYRRIRVTGKMGVRTLLFNSPVGRAVRTYIGDSKSGYVFVEQKPQQRLRMQRSPVGQWRCSWKVYDTNGFCIATRRRFLGARKKLDYLEAKRYFARLDESFA